VGWFIGDFFGDPIEGGGQGGEQESTEGELLKKWGEGDTEGKEDPRGSGGAEDAVDGRVSGAGKEYAVEHGEDEADYGCRDEPGEALAGAACVPLQSGEEAAAPNCGKEEQASAQGEAVEDGFGAEGVVDFCGGLGEGGDAEEMVGDSDLGGKGCDSEASEGEQNEDAYVAHVGDAFLVWGCAAGEVLEQLLAVLSFWWFDWDGGVVGDGFKKRRRFNGGDLAWWRGFLAVDWGLLRLVAHWATGFFLRVVFLGGAPFVSGGAFSLSQVSSNPGAPIFLLIKALLEATAGPSTPCVAFRSLRMTDFLAEFLLIDALLIFSGLKPSVARGATSGAS